MSAQASVDISLILNLHNETKYLTRTLLAMEEAIRFAESYGVSFELIVVLDKPASSTRDWIYKRDLTDLCRASIVECHHGSLGVARNEGISRATGEYIATVDADDIMSFNMFLGLYLAARSSGRHAIAIQQYVLAFGSENFLVEYFGTGKINKLGFFSYHPYVSRILAHRSLFENNLYSDAKLSSGYAYEDWHFACEAISRGSEFVIAENTIMFYRQRQNSLLRAADKVSVRQIPPTSLFKPRAFLGVCAQDFKRFRDGEIQADDVEKIRQQFDRNRGLWELTSAAASIDPAITMRNATSLPIYTNLSGALSSGAAYFRLCSLIGDRQLTDVVLLPYISKGGGDKYILDVIEALSETEPHRSFLVLTGEPFERHAWLDRLPESALFIDMYRTCRGCTEAELLLVTLRLIENFAPDATIHMKSSVYAVRFFEKYHAVLSSFKIVFYRFSDPHYIYNDLVLCAGYMFNFISDYGEHFWKIITDNSKIKRHDMERFDSFADRWHLLSAKCVEGCERERVESSETAKMRLLWASRLDPEKRPDLLIKIANAIRGRLPDLTIDVFGTAATDNFDIASFDGLPNLAYRGGFSRFSEVDPAGYDLFLYTSAFDGLPNVVLEAMASGLPVIAPDIGGIAEVVKTGETGWLLPNWTDDDRLVAAYCDAVCSAFDPATDLNLVRLKAFDLISRQHSAEQFLDAVGTIFECGPKQHSLAYPAVALSSGLAGR